MEFNSFKLDLAWHNGVVCGQLTAFDVKNIILEKSFNFFFLKDTNK